LPGSWQAARTDARPLSASKAVFELDPCRQLARGGTDFSQVKSAEVVYEF
jgi:hypothetical protein